MQALIYDLLPYVLPILWMAAATIVALFLYRTSRALVEHTVASGTQTRRVRLVGSVAIALVVFVLLWRATPSLSGDPSTFKLTSAKAHQLNVRQSAVVQAWDRYQSCMNVPGVDRCPEENTDVDTSIRQLNDEYQSALDAGRKP